MSKRISVALIVAVLGLGLLLLYTALPKDFLNDVLQRFNPFVAQESGTEEPSPSYAAEESPPSSADQTQKASTEPKVFSPVTVSNLREQEVSYPLDAPLRSDPDARDRVTYDNVINQFEVEENPRYAQRDHKHAQYSYCNVFVWDVTRAMGAEIPIWVDENGELVEPFTDQNREKNYIYDNWDWRWANDINTWLNQYGGRSGWHEVSAERAQDFANQGHPTVATWYNHDPQGYGHTGMVRPGVLSTDGPALAQAGIPNVNYTYVYNFFPREGTQFFTHS